MTFRDTETLFSPCYRIASPEPVKRAASEMTTNGTRSRKCQMVLDALRDGPKTGVELAERCHTYRYSARIHDLRKAGFGILTTPLGSGGWLHTLTHDIEGSR